jgi:hypothetical protein
MKFKYIYGFLVLMLAVAIFMARLTDIHGNNSEADLYPIKGSHQSLTSHAGNSRDPVSKIKILRKSKSEKVNLLLNEWLNVDWNSEKKIFSLADKSIEDLSVSDDLVELIQLLNETQKFTARTAIDLRLKKLYSTYNAAVIESLIAMSGADNLPESDSLWYKSNGCNAMALQCDDKQFESFISRLEGVPRRKAVEGYALKLAEIDPTKALSIILSNLPENGKWNVRSDGKKYDIDFSTLHYVIGRMSIEESMILFEKSPTELMINPNRNSDLYRFYKSGYDEIFDKYSTQDVRSAVSLIEKFPHAYDTQTYLRLLYGNEYKPDNILQYIPAGKVYDELLGQITVPKVPEREVTDGLYIPKKADYDKYLEVLDRIQSCADATNTAPSKQQLLNSVAKARAKAAELRNSITE